MTDPGFAEFTDAIRRLAAAIESQPPALAAALYPRACRALSRGHKTQ